eukprot:snap_masked-scaffold1639_size32527-processed-gene-0.2 protein:Tk03551 transcript:snap_masked-scaffold1639_size32527-processed-gene-0.2-mRNA-1 annotation:"PREDICTED: uncharacterized protein LOC100214701"
MVKLELVPELEVISREEMMAEHWNLVRLARRTITVEQTIQWLAHRRLLANTNKDCNEESGGMAKDIQIDWANFHHDICGQHLLKNPTVIGGVQEDENGTSTPVIVEIDESLLAKAKYNLGRWPEQRWVFGGVERQTGHCFMVEVPDRRRETLEAEIKGFIRPGTQILSDGWAAYNKVDEFAGGNYTHSVIVHEHNFVGPSDPTIHTQHIEGC